MMCNVRMPLGLCKTARMTALFRPQARQSKARDDSLSCATGWLIEVLRTGTDTGQGKQILTKTQNFQDRVRVQVPGVKEQDEKGCEGELQRDGGRGSRVCQDI